MEYCILAIIYKTISNMRPSWIEDAPKAIKMIEKKWVLGLEDAPKSLKNKYKGVL